jgi:homocysteine S-methyltransferase
LALKARDAFPLPLDVPRPLVAASIGSYGAFLATGAEYRGGYGLSVDALAAWHRPRVRIFERSGADLLSFETIPSREEVEAIVRVLGEEDGPPAWIAFSATHGSRIADGTPVEQAFAIAGSCGRAVAVGVNCVTPELIAPLLARGRSATDKPLVAYPNRGDVWDPIARAWIRREAPVDLGALVPAWRAAGAVLIGGCCRTTPADIRSIVAAL